MKRGLRLLALAALLLALPAMVVLAAPEDEEDSTGPAIAAADTDGDKIPDTIEKQAWYRNKGGSHRHKDVWVECDYMQGLKPNAKVAGLLKKPFAVAPLKNPDGKPGINLHFTVDDQFPFEKQWGDIDTNAGFKKMVNKLLDRRKKSFDGAPFTGNSAKTMKKYTHYCVFINSMNKRGTSGISLDSTGGFGIPGDVFIVSLGLWTPKGGSLAQQVGTAMHELGHNLGLRHGGNDHQNFKPNYLSVMNYHYQSGFYREFKKPAQCGGSAPCAKQVSEWDYSRFVANNLNEKRLKEADGVKVPAGIAKKYVGLQICATNAQKYYFNYNKSVNWNCDNKYNPGAIAADINGDGQKTDLGKGQNNWANIVFDGGAIGGIGSSMASEYLDPGSELDWETQQELPEVLHQH